MNIDAATLDAAIEQYAILLDRPYWFDPDRRDLQVGAWLLLSDEYVDTPGKLLVTDFIEAITRLLFDRTARDIMPSMIVGMAVDIANARYYLVAEERVNHPMEMLLMRELNALSDAIWRARMSDNIVGGVATAVAAFGENVERVRQLLYNSGFDDDAVAPRIAWIDQREALALERVETADLSPVPTPATPSDEDWEKMKHVIRDEML